MSLIKCPECGKEVSEHAESCPSCAYPINPNKAEPGFDTSRKNYLTGLLILCGIVLLVGVLGRILLIMFLGLIGMIVAGYKLMRINTGGPGDTYPP